MFVCTLGSPLPRLRLLLSPRACLPPSKGRKKKYQKLHLGGFAAGSRGRRELQIGVTTGCKFWESYVWKGFGASEHHCEQKAPPKDLPRQENIFISLGSAKLITRVSPSFVATSQILQY